MKLLLVVLQTDIASFLVGYNFKPSTHNNPVRPAPSVAQRSYLVNTESGAATDINEKLDRIERMLEDLIEEVKTLSERQVALEERLTQQVHVPYSSRQVISLSPLKDDSGKPMTNTIEKMASSKPEIRSQVNMLRCLEDLGLPVSSSTDEVIIIVNIFLYYCVCCDR